MDFLLAFGPIKQLAEKYRAEFEENFDHCLKYSIELGKNYQNQFQNLVGNFQNVQPKILAKRDVLRQTLENVQEPIKEDTSVKLLPTFSWLTILQFGIFISALFSSYMLYPFIGLVLGSFWSVVLAYGILPIFAYHQINSEDNERTARFKLLAFSLIEGLLSGFLFSHRYLSGIQPLVFLTPLTITIAISSIPTILNKNSPRMTLLSTCLGSSIAIHLVIGLILEQLSFAYLLLITFYALISFCTIQFCLNIDTHIVSLNSLCMFGNVMGVLFIQAIIFLLLGGSKNDGE